jgi:hypothetical protein
MRKFTEAERLAGREARKAGKAERAEKRRETAEKVKRSLEELAKDAPAGKYRDMCQKEAARERVSLPVLIKLMCLSCTCWQQVEVRQCAITACPLWAVRSYQTG